MYSIFGVFIGAQASDKRKTERERSRDRKREKRNEKERDVKCYIESLYTTANILLLVCARVCVCTLFVVCPMYLCPSVNHRPCIRRI